MIADLSLLRPIRSRWLDTFMVALIMLNLCLVVYEADQRAQDIDGGITNTRNHNTTTNPVNKTTDNKTASLGPNSETHKLRHYHWGVVTEELRAVACPTPCRKPSVEARINQITNPCYWLSTRHAPARVERDQHTVSIAMGAVRAPEAARSGDRLAWC